MVVIVSKQFKENFEIAQAQWLEQGDTPEQIAELKAAIRVDLDDGPGFFRESEHAIPDPAERRKLWEDYFQAIANDFNAIYARNAGCHARIVNKTLTERTQNAKADPSPARHGESLLGATG